MIRTWVLVADSARARVFSASAQGAPMLEVLSLVHPEGRLHEQAMNSDRPGRSFDSQGPGRHGMEDRISARRQDNMYFAERIADTLDQARHKGRFDRLVVIAAPEFLGHISAKLTRGTAKRIVLRLDKNLSRQPAREISARLPQTVWNELNA